MDNRPDSTVQHNGFHSINSKKPRREEHYPGILPDFNSKNIKWRSPLINSPNMRHSPKNQSNLFDFIEKNHDENNTNRKQNQTRNNNYSRSLGSQTANLIFSSRRNPKNKITKKVAFPLSDQEFIEEEIEPSKQNAELSEFNDLESFGSANPGTTRGDFNSSSSSLGKYYTTLIQTQPSQTKQDEKKNGNRNPPLEEVSCSIPLPSEVDLQRRESKETMMPLERPTQMPSRNYDLPSEFSQKELTSRPEMKFSQRQADFGYRRPVENYMRSYNRYQPYRSPERPRYSPYLNASCRHHHHPCCSHHDPYLNHLPPKPYWDPMMEDMRRARGYPGYHAPEPPEDIRQIRNEYYAPEPHYVRPEDSLCFGARDIGQERGLFRKNINPFENHEPESFNLNYRPTFPDLEQGDLHRQKFEPHFTPTSRAPTQSVQIRRPLHLNSFEERLNDIIVPSPRNSALSYPGFREPNVDTRLFRERSWNGEDHWQWCRNPFNFEG